MRLLLLLALAAIPAQLPAQPQVVTCDDGSKWTVSPFNPDPCKNLNTPLATTEYPIDFLLVHGGPPQPTGNSFADRVARVQYEAKYNQFVGLAPEPDNYNAAYYSNWGFGPPLWYETKYGNYVVWKDALGGECTSVATTAILGPGVTVARCQVRAIRGGQCLPLLQAFVPNALRLQNSKNCTPPTQAEVE